MDISILLKKLARPAQRALLGAGFATLEQLSAVTEKEIADLHGIGENALQVISRTLEENGLSFSNEKEERR